MLVIKIINKHGIWKAVSKLKADVQKKQRDGALQLSLHYALHYGSGWRLNKCHQQGDIVNIAI